MVMVLLLKVVVIFLLTKLVFGKYPDTYAKSIFILNYDEGGQFYDHLWTPTAPMNDNDGKSTVSTVGEVTINTNFNIPPGNPIGPGFRVPLFIISPFTRKNGGIVFSQVTDHTSVIKLVEKRFKVHCPNISPWRRAVMSDLTYKLIINNLSALIFIIYVGKYFAIVSSYSYVALT